MGECDIDFEGQDGPPHARALACFRHPATWAAIGLLLLNDHVLKSAWPSILTGKLSDFAGLYFFPFLLAALLGPLAAAVAPRHRRAEWAAKIGPAAFVLTALWFAAIKTVPPANALTADAIGAILGTGPARIALDPTDVIALIILWPAWRLWRGVRVETRRPLHAWRLPLRVQQVSGTIALVVAAAATMATSQAAQTTLVNRLAVEGSDIYTGTAHRWEPAASELAGQRYPADVYPGATPQIERNCDGNRSGDGGHTWIWLSEIVSAPVCARLAADRDTPVVACVPGQVAVCYRTAPTGQVETTHDGGRSWSLAWGLPQHRLEFMRRADGRSGETLFLGRTSFDPGPFDIVVLPAQNGHRVVVAMGSEGVAVRDPDGTWTQEPVDAATPTPLRATTVTAAVAVSRQPFWLALGLSLGLGWALARRSGQRGRAWAARIAILAIWYCLALALPVIALPGVIVYLMIAPMMAFLAGAAVLSRLLLRARTRSGDPAAPMPADKWLVRAAVGAFFLAAWVPFPLWAFGLIPSYGLAIGVAVLGGGLVLVWGWQQARVDVVDAE
jgi:hypothetical protein